MVAPWRKLLSAMTTIVSWKNSLRKVGSHFHALDRTTLYTANRDISYYTVHESFVATIPLVFCEAEKMDPNTQFLKVMMIDEPAILDQAIARIPQEVKEKYTVLKSAPYFPTR